MRAKDNAVRWEPAHELTPCSECGEFILVGQPMAIWMEVTAADIYGHRDRIQRHYCEDDGHLLEDSLSTTETGLTTNHCPLSTVH
jgi:hypothetical protein